MKRLLPFLFVVLAISIVAALATTGQRAALVRAELVRRGWLDESEETRELPE